MSWSINEPDYHRYCDTDPCVQCREWILQAEADRAATAAYDRLLDLYSRRADSGWA